MKTDASFLSKTNEKGFNYARSVVKVKTKTA
jgi:hypothetical protein